MIVHTYTEAVGAMKRKKVKKLKKELRYTRKCMAFYSDRYWLADSAIQDLFQIIDGFQLSTVKKFRDFKAESLHIRDQVDALTLK